MGGYLVNFSVYTFAMIGFLFLAVAIYKKSSVNIKSNKKGGMEIEESLSLSPRKRLHVVRVNDEKFLIAADTERTEFLAKLDNSENAGDNKIVNFQQKPQGIIKGGNISQFSEKLQEKIKNIQLVHGNVALKSQPQNYPKTRLSEVKNKNVKKAPIMREILRKLEV